MTVSAEHPIKGNGLANALRDARDRLGQPDAPLVIVLVTDNAELPQLLRSPQRIANSKTQPYAAGSAHLLHPQYILRLEVRV